MNSIIKYPRTRHIEGSCLQAGDEDLKSVPFEEIKGKFLVIEEKMDGANAGISFSETGDLLLQSRGHYLTGGYRERHFSLFKTWANTFAYQLWDILGDRYIMYGEWMYAKHTMFYTHLPHYFLEFDIYDKQTGLFLDTEARREILEFLPFVQSVKVLFEGNLENRDQLHDMVQPSHFTAAGHLDVLKELCRKEGLRVETVLKETDASFRMEGLYIKQEGNGIVEDRFKFVRGDFLNSILDSGTHWLDRPIVPNQLAEGVNIFL